MRCVRLTLIALLLVAFSSWLGCGGSSKQTSTPGQTTSIPTVALAELVRNPAKYHQRTVRVRGVFVNEFENVSVQSEDGSRLESNDRYYSDAVWVEASPSLRRYRNQVVSIEGTFDRTQHGHLGLWAGTLRNAKKVK